VAVKAIGGNGVGLVQALGMVGHQASLKTIILP